METTKLKRFAQHARKLLRGIVSTKIDKVLQEGSSARRENPNAIRALEKERDETSKEQVIEKVAYIWFNRFVALRFMDVNRYTKVNIVSPEPGQFQPSILSDAKMGHIDESIVNEKTKEKVLAFLENRSPSSDPQGEAYKLLVVAACNYYNTSMPFLFERIEDYTELLIPDDLLSGDSILAYTREAMTPDVCEDVEVIGWLYQFYISEKKNEVFEGIKKNKKVAPENIPAATQLFTPHWIVKYMVENSLGRLWKLNNPNSSLHMEYYIEPETKESDYLKISSPTELKICDPACGSGHILVYAFDLLYEIYKEAGYTDDDTIVENIIKNNLYGIEIDERAAELAAFALIMKAASKSGSKRRFFRNTIEPNICKLEKIKFEDDELDSYMDAVGRDLFTEDLKTTLKQFEQADNFGSLIVPVLQNVSAIEERLIESKITNDLFLAPIHEKVLKLLTQINYLSSNYHIICANPPYMGNRNINKNMKDFAEKNFSDSKSDLFSMFIERSLLFVKENGLISMITMQSWMFLSSFESLRLKILNNRIISLIHLGPHGFDSIGGEVVATCSFCIEKKGNPNSNTAFLDLVKGKNEKEKQKNFMETKNKPIFLSSKYFENIPGKPISFKLSKKELNAFSTNTLETNTDICIGMKTGDNDKFLRHWHEIEDAKIYYNCSSINEANMSDQIWFPYLKGGSFRKWYGNFELLLNWENEGDNIKNHVNKSGISDSRLRPSNFDFYFKSGADWSFTATTIGVRIHDEGFFFDVGGSSMFTNNDSKLFLYTGYLNSLISRRFLSALNPTLSIQIENVKALPIPKITAEREVIYIIEKLKNISKIDWNSYETSWDFKSLPLLQTEHKNTCINDSYQSLLKYWKTQVDEMKMLEEENNDIFIKAYGLEDELEPEVPLKEITLTCNPPYRYDDKKSEEELEALLLTDTIKEYISYAVGVMLGRYSLDHEGLHIANQDETVEDVNKRFNISTPTFEADDDNVIPILDGDWFTDDISERFFQFVKVTFGEDNYEENIDFIADALNEKNKNSIETIRKYFIKDFYNDHVKRYKKRPIYWMFSSPKGSFQALIYMHRYKSDTVSVILNDYLRNFITKLEATKDNLEALSGKADASKSEKNKAIKDIENIKKMILECQEYADEVIYPLATEKLEIDLDNGVKHNYPLFGKALKKVTGLS